MDLYRSALPRTLAAAGFGRVRSARAIVLILSALALFVLYASPALEQSDPVSDFMERTSLIIVPAVLIATGRRNVLSDLPAPSGPQVRQERAAPRDPTSDASGHQPADVPGGPRSPDDGVGS